MYRKNARQYKQVQLHDHCSQSSNSKMPVLTRHHIQHRMHHAHAHSEYTRISDSNSSSCASFHDVNVNFLSFIQDVDSMIITLSYVDKSTSQTDEQIQMISHNINKLQEQM